MARPPKKIDYRHVEALASIMCTTSEIAAGRGCSPDTLERRFAKAMKRGRLRGRQSLRRKQYQMAMEGNAALVIWLGKQHLRQGEEGEGSDAKCLTFADFIRAAREGIGESKRRKNQ